MERVRSTADFYSVVIITRGNIAAARARYEGGERVIHCAMRKVARALSAGKRERARVRCNASRDANYGI